MTFFLQGIEQPMLLLESPVGLTYQNQCDGLRCVIREAEGFLIPISSSPEMKEIEALFESGNVTSEALKKAIGEELYAYLGEDWPKPWMRIVLDEDRLDEVLEAWVPVRIGEMRGYLIWCNSD